MTSPANSNHRKRAAAKHETVLQAWKDAVNVAEQTERDGYWPVAVNDDDGYFELTKPPSVLGVEDNTNNNNDDGGISTEDARMAEAMAAAVEKAMELNSKQNGNDNDNDNDKE